MKTEKLVLLLFIFSFFACNNTGESTEKNADSAKVEIHVNAEEHAEATSGLSLNNGAKWKTDESTRNHVQKVSVTIDSFNKKSNPDVSEYQLFAAEMETEVNALIKDCRMTGPDHDALHQWLQPILKSVNDLKKVQTIEEGQHNVQMLTEQVQKFNIYFN